MVTAVHTLESRAITHLMTVGRTPMRGGKAPPCHRPAHAFFRLATRIGR